MDKIALITGCNRGIGKATMELFIQNGISVIACTRILSDSLTVYYKSLEEKYNVKIYPIKCDLSDEDSIKTAMKEVYALKIPIDILVNNAGIAKFSSLLMTRLEEVKKDVSGQLFCFFISDSIYRKTNVQKKGRGDC